MEIFQIIYSKTIIFLVVQIMVKQFRFLYMIQARFHVAMFISMFIYHKRITLLIRKCFKGGR